MHHHWPLSHLVAVVQEELEVLQLLHPLDIFSSNISDHRYLILALLKQLLIVYQVHVCVCVCLSVCLCVRACMYACAYMCCSVHSHKLKGFMTKQIHNFNSFSPLYGRLALVIKCNTHTHTHAHTRTHTHTHTHTHTSTA